MYVAGRMWEKGYDDHYSNGSERGKKESNGLKATICEKGIYAHVGIKWNYCLPEDEKVGEKVKKNPNCSKWDLKVFFLLILQFYILLLSSTKTCKKCC